MLDEQLYLYCVWVLFLLTSVYLHLTVDRWDSISSTEQGHVNHKDSIIPHMWR